MIVLDEEIRTRLANAIDDGKTLTAAYVDTAGKPHISFYGSTHAHGDDQLAIWVRSPDSELLKTIPTRPDIVFIYGDIGSRFYMHFTGRARVTEDPDERQRIYDTMHPIERQFEPEMKGIAVVIDLDRVQVLSKAGVKVMER